jgi:hypothetical protein
MILVENVEKENVEMTDLLFVMHDKYVFINAEKQIQEKIDNSITSYLFVFSINNDKPDNSSFALISFLRNLLLRSRASATIQNN